jgi:hypothetical protein
VGVHHHSTRLNIMSLQKSPARKLNELAEEVKQLRSVVTLNGPIPPLADTSSGSPSSSTHATPPDSLGQSPRFRRQSSSLDFVQNVDPALNRYESPEATFRRPSNPPRSERSASWTSGSRRYSLPANNYQSLEHITLNPQQITRLFRV